MAAEQVASLAIASGKPGDAEMAAVQKLRLEREALELGEQAQAKLAREEAERKLQAQITSLRTELADADAVSIKTLRECETALRQAAAANRAHFAAEATKRKAQAQLNNMTGEKVPIKNEMQLIRERSLQWASQIRTITRHPSEFGVLKIPNVTPDPNKSWEK
jgi:hypothetical protein